MKGHKGLTVRPSSAKHLDFFPRTGSHSNPARLSLILPPPLRLGRAQPRYQIRWAVAWGGAGQQGSQVQAGAEAEAERKRGSGTAGSKCSGPGPVGRLRIRPGISGSRVEWIGSAHTIDNYTRFLLLSRQPHHPSDTPSHASQRPSSATGNSSTHFYALSDPAHIGALAARGSIVTVHSRPAPPSVPVSPHAAAAKGASGGGADGGRYPVSVLLELRLNSHGSGDDSANASGEVNGTKSDSGSAARNGEEREWGLEWEREGVVYLGSAPA